jgi:single-strand DNA-binding protein
MINRTVIEGRLMKEPEIRKLPSGKEMARLVLVHSRKYKNKKEEWREEVHFFEVNVYSPRLIQRVKRLEKGDRVLVEGQLKQDKWTADNKTNSKIRIKATRIQLIAKPKSSTSAVKKQAPAIA